MVKFTLNGQTVEYDGDPQRTLLSYLRDVAGLKSVKDGCSGEGTCGACIVECNGKPNLSCRLVMAKMQDAEVVTLEGVPEETRRCLGEAFVQAGAVQCGFCSPGMLTRTRLLLEKNPDPTRDEVTRRIKPHLCRCTGYVKIVDGVLNAARALRQEGGAIESGAGSDRKFQAFERAVGEPLFVGGMEIDGMLHGALHFSEHPRARVLRIDTAAAEALPGVVRVITARDVPGERTIGMIVTDWDIYIAEGEVTRCIGDVLALVVAESDRVAREAAALIDVEYEVLEPVTDPFEALKDEIRVHEGGNLLKESVIRFGEDDRDIEEVLAASAYVVGDTFRTQRIEHGFLELESSVACYEEGRLTVYSQSQGIYEDRKQIADLLGLQPADLNVKLVPAGGAFGGKEDLTVQGHAALAAFLLKRPVQVRLDRRESLRMHPKRHPMTLEYRLGCDAEGNFTGLYARIVGDTGAYASAGGPVLERAATHAGGAYYIPNVDVKSQAVYTNNLVCGAMRGFGVNQVTFAIEGLIDELCEQAGFDRWEIRYRNALDTGLLTTSGHRLRKEVGLKQTLEKVKPDYERGRVTGLACAIKNCGLGNGIPELSEARLEILPAGRIRLYHGWSEMGQGIDTVARQMLCRYVGLDDPSRIDVIVNTDSETRGGSTTASRGTYLVGKAVLAAAEDFKKDLETHSLEELAGRTYDGSFLCDWTTPYDGDQEVFSHFAYSFATHLVTLDEDGRVAKVTAAHDSGKVVNRQLFEGQIEGGVVMGLGYALTENLELENGQLVDSTFRGLGLLRSTDVPEIEVIPVEADDPDAPLGAKGVGEICCIPTAAAVAGAYRAFDGRMRTALPLEPLARDAVQ